VFAEDWVFSDVDERTNAVRSHDTNSLGEVVDGELLSTYIAELSASQTHVGKILIHGLADLNQNLIGQSEEVE
jgi:hypothetical protein